MSRKTNKCFTFSSILSQRPMEKKLGERKKSANAKSCAHKSRTCLFLMRNYTSNASAILASLSSILKADYRGIIPYCSKIFHLDLLISLDTDYMADRTIRILASFLQNFSMKQSSLKVSLHAPT